MAAGGAEHQAFLRGLPAFAAPIADMGNQVQGRRELAITGLSIAASMLLPVGVIGLVPEGAAVTVAGATLSGRALALAGANGLLSTVLNAAGQYDQTGTVQLGNALAGGAADALGTYFGMQVLEKTGKAGGLTLGAITQSSSYFAAGSVGSYVLGTPGALQGMLNGNPKYWEGAAKAGALSFVTSAVTTGIMAALPYPEAGNLAARNARIEAEVAKMGFRPGTPEAEALAEMQKLGISPTDVWQGSHVVVKDGGALYDEWKGLEGVTSRSGSSSHYPGVPTEQFQIRFGDSALLFGKDAAGNTWFQMEGHAIGAGVAGAVANPSDTAAHLWDYLVYKVRGQNVGPLGLSPWTEPNPKVVTPPLAAQPVPDRGAASSRRRSFSRRREWSDPREPRRRQRSQRIVIAREPARNREALRGPRRDRPEGVLLRGAVRGNICRSWRAAGGDILGELSQRAQQPAQLRIRPGGLEEPLLLDARPFNLHGTRSPHRFRRPPRWRHGPSRRGAPARGAPLRSTRCRCRPPRCRAPASPRARRGSPRAASR